MRSAFLISFLLTVVTATPCFSQSPRTIPVEEFAALPVNSGVRLSPNGENVLIMTKYQGQRIVLVKPLAEGGAFKGVAIPPQEGMEILWATWKNDEYILIAMSFEYERNAGTGLQRETRLMSVPIHNPKKSKNMALPSKEVNAAYGVTNTGRAVIGEGNNLPRNQADIIDLLPNDPDHFLLEIDEDTSDLADEVRRVDVTSGNYKLVFDPSNDGGSWVTDLSGAIRFGYGGRYSGTSLSDVKYSWHYLNPETNQWVVYQESEFGEIEDFTVYGFYEDPRYAYMRMRGENGFFGLYKYDMVALKPVETLYTSERGDIGGAISDVYTNQIVGVDTGWVETGNYYFDENYQHLQSMIDNALPGAINVLQSHSRDGTRFIVSSRSDVDSGSYYFFDVPNRHLIFLEASYNGLDPRLMSPMKAVSYEARDGLTIPAFLTIPLGVEPKNLPTVVLPHGGPTSHDEFGYDYLVQFLASRGYAVLQPEFRGSNGYGKEFQDAGKRQWGQKMQDDVSDGAKWLVDQGIADPERMCIFGWSYGGYAALTATIKTPNLFKCSISINGISDLVKLIGEESNFLGGKEWGELIGNRREDRGMLEDNSAYDHTDVIQVPILMIASKDDTTVNYEQSTQLYKRLKDKGKPVEYVEIKEGNHSIRNEPGQLIILQSIESFLARNIGQ
jgi:dienelactone hydrolase